VGLDPLGFKNFLVCFVDGLSSNIFALANNVLALVALTKVCRVPYSNGPN